MGRFTVPVALSSLSFGSGATSIAQQHNMSARKSVRQSSKIPPSITLDELRVVDYPSLLPNFRSRVLASGPDYRTDMSEDRGAESCTTTVNDHTKDKESSLLN